MRINDSQTLSRIVDITNADMKRGNRLPEGRFQMLFGEVTYILDQMQGIVIRDTGDDTFALLLPDRAAIDDVTWDGLAIALRDAIELYPARWSDDAAVVYVAARELAFLTAQADAARRNLYDAIKDGVARGMNESEAARIAGIDRTTVRRLLGK